MPKYILAGGWEEDELWDDDYLEQRGLDVPDHVATFTGLIAVTGQRIMREARPVGFGRDSEW